MNRDICLKKSMNFTEKIKANMTVNSTVSNDKKLEEVVIILETFATKEPEEAALHPESWHWCEKLKIITQFVCVFFYFTKKVLK